MQKQLDKINKIYGSEVHVFSGFEPQDQGCTQEHAAQTAYTITTGAGRVNVKGICTDVPLSLI